MIWTLTIILSTYFLFLLLLIAGWSRMKRSKVTAAAPDHKITVLVALRNESANAGPLLDSLINQDHPDYEIILVDDHSEDSTRDAINAFLMKNSDSAKNISCLRNEGVGKKAALTTGVIHAKGVIIVTTDADCRPGNQWLSTISRSFHDHVNMMTGGVRMKQDGTSFADMQAIEFASLIGTTAATLAFGVPTMCNGANLAFRKSAFMEVGGYKENIHIPSGDDEFLMRKINDRYPGTIGFLNDPQSVVTTTPSPTLLAFIQQRIRWAGKWRFNTSVTTNLVAFYVIIVQAALLTSFILLPSADYLILLSLLVIRMILEFWFLYQVTRFLNVSWNISAFIILQIFYPWYVILIGMTSSFMPYSWKERTWRQSVS